jgi:hypothetical protein
MGEMVNGGMGEWGKDKPKFEISLLIYLHDSI